MSRFPGLAREIKYYFTVCVCERIFCVGCACVVVEAPRCLLRVASVCKCAEELLVCVGFNMLQANKWGRAPRYGRRFSLDQYSNG